MLGVTIIEVRKKMEGKQKKTKDEKEEEYHIEVSKLNILLYKSIVITCSLKVT